VIDRETLAEVAVWNAQLGTDLAGQSLEALARYYNEAVVCPEANHYGAVAVDYLKRCYDRQRIYTRSSTKPDAIREGRETAYGFRTDAATKPLLIAGLEEAIRNRTVAIRHPATIHELRVFERSPSTGRMGAAAGQHDDRVIGLALALLAHKELGKIPPAGQQRPGPRIAAGMDYPVFSL